MSIQQHDPMHPGVFIKQVYLEPFNINTKELAGKLQVRESRGEPNHQRQGQCNANHGAQAVQGHWPVPGELASDAR